MNVQTGKSGPWAIVPAARSTAMNTADEKASES
jgi:hypothetical protein